MNRSDIQTLTENCPTAWFSVLERARTNRDSRLTERALRELHRLGYVVAFIGGHS